MRRLLIVDDDPGIRSMMRLIFERAGYEVVEAGHGGAALERLKVSRPDVVVTDLMMPVMDGFGLISRLRSDPDTSTIPIVVVSSNPDSDEAGRMADGAVPKPFLPAELLQAVRSLLRESGRGTA